MKKLAVALLILILLAAAGTAVFWQAFTRGVGGFDDWVVRKVIDIAELYLVPDVEFDTFNYDAGTVTLKGVRLVAPDGTKVVNAGSIRVTLKGIPVTGGAVIIERVEIHDADLRLIRTQTADGAVVFRGLIPFVERTNVKNQDQVEKDMQLDSAFAIKLIALSNCSISYEPGQGEPPMTLGGISAEMNVNPVNNDTATTGGLGTYALDLEIDRAPLLTIAMRGDLNLDDITLALTQLNLAADIGHPDTLASLPGPIQKLLRDHDARGTIALDATGTLDATAPTDSTLNANLHLKDLNFATGEYRFPIDTGTISMNLANRTARFPTLTLTSCQGTISANGARVDLSESRRAQLAWSIDGFQLHELLRQHQKGEDAAPKLAGVVTSSGNINAALNQLPTSITGRGKVSVRDGWLINFPIQKALAGAMEIFELASADSSIPTDKADVTFDLDGQGFQVHESTVETSVMAGNGTGTLYYDQRLDLLISAGPLEKLQKKAGAIGDIIGMVTDQLIKYEVQGTLAKPEVKIRPLGIGG